MEYIQHDRKNLGHFAGCHCGCEYLAPILAPYDPNKTDMSVKLSAFCAVHPLGTDHLGRDLLSRLMYGGRTSILLAVIATMLSMLVGLILGVASGYAGGWVDQIFLIFTSMFQGLPGTCVMIALVGIFGCKRTESDRGARIYFLG